MCNPIRPSTLLVALLVFLIAGVPIEAAADPAPPNILFFITDDESAVERSAYGRSRLPTPAFERVAKDGVLFANGFSTAPSCAPSRASVLTGRQFWELEQGAFIQAFIPRKTPTVPQVLADHGYEVACTGKGWGPGSHSALGIPADSLGRSFAGATIADPPRGVAANDYAANFSRFLEARDATKPFFFWAGVAEPHDPWGPDNHVLLEQEFGVTLDEVTLPPFVEDTPHNRRERANFLYEICVADRHLARMLASLESHKLAENTLVVVTADNGTWIVDAAGEQRGKASPYDLGCHVPLAMMWPAKVPRGRTVTDFVSFADFAPTFLAAAGLRVPEGMTGRSLLPILTSAKSGRIEPERDSIITGLEWHGEVDPESRSSRTIRDDRYAYLVRYANVDTHGQPLDAAALVKPVKEELYDLEQDPWQLHDLAGNPAVAAEQRRLATELREAGTRRGDPRFTGDMAVFVNTRSYVQKRKQMGYDLSVITLGYPRLVAEQTGHLWFPKIDVLPGGRLQVVCSGQPDSYEADHMSVDGSCQTTSQDHGHAWAPLTPWRYGGLTNWREKDRLVGLPWQYAFSDTEPTALKGELVAVDAAGKIVDLPDRNMQISGFPRPLSQHTGLAVFATDCDGVVIKGTRMLTLGYGTFAGDEEKHRTGTRSKDAYFGYSLIAIESLDGGRNWRVLSTVCDWTHWENDPAWVDRGRFEGPSESGLVELADGSLLAVYRIGMFEQNPLHQSMSTDGGKTWSTPKALPAFSVLPSLQRLSGGGLILATGRPGIWLWYSADGRGDRWEPIDALAHHNAAVASDHPEWLIGPTEQFNRFHTSSNVRIREIAPDRLLLIYDRVPFDWRPVPKDSPERNRIFVLPVQVAPTGR
jgi:uncharacterized sulfatase